MRVDDGAAVERLQTGPRAHARVPREAAPPRAAAAAVARRAR
jgi:hypothetical protein